ncbi:MAG: tRNA pseudouridine(55) synthase TruB, partial [Acidimicrobiia bacterium]
AGERKVGHAGTLDPMATGLLMLALNRATRLLRFVQDLPKTYLARAVFGVATDTLDAEGRVLSREPAAVTEDEVQTVMRRFVGRINQVPPMVSAIKVEGRHLYQLAREGREVERDPRSVEVYALEVVDFAPSDYPEVELLVNCSKGTYVRTLVDDIARGLGSRAHLSALRRVGIGSFAVGESHSIETMEEAAAQDQLGALVLSAAMGLRDLPAVKVGGDVERGVRHGKAFPVPDLGDEVPGHGVFRVLDDEGTLLAIYRRLERRAAPEVVVA